MFINLSKYKVELTVNGHGSWSGPTSGFGRLPEMIFDGKSVDGNGELFGVNAGKLFLPAAVFVELVQHFVGDDLRTIAANFFHSLRVGIKFEHA